MSEENIGYSVLRTYLAGDSHANRCFVGLSKEEQERLISGAQDLRTVEEAASYVWDYIDRQGR